MIQNVIPGGPNGNEMPMIVTGTYTGDGTASRTISLGFTPKAVLVLHEGSGTLQSGVYSGGLAVTGFNVASNTSYRTQWNDYYSVLAVVTNGFKVNYNSSYKVNSNQNGYVYTYIAIA